jgi:hypothetical protein
MKTKVLLVYSFSILISLFTSCSTTPKGVREALEASGINRAELEKVIEHYQTTGETQKLKATYFLIANMAGKCSEYYNYNDEAYKIVTRDKEDSLFRSRGRVAYDSLCTQIELLKDIAGRYPLITKDVETISSSYLIENIDYAFRAWREPWARHFSFDEFCQYILPYRVRNEPLSNWRKILYEKYSWVKDSLKNRSDPEELMLRLNDIVAKDFWTVDKLEMPFVSVMLLDKAKSGGCNQRYLLMISLLRAMGIPAMMDYAPQHDQTFKQHAWVVYLDSTHRFRPCDAGRVRSKGFKKDNPKSAFPPTMIIPLGEGFGSNVLRYTYDINHESLAEQEKGKHADLPKLFQESNIKDVTQQYSFDTRSFAYNLEAEPQLKDNELTYLAVFGYGSEIREATYARVKDNKVMFGPMGTNIVYLVCVYRGDRLIPISQPLLLRDSCQQVEVLRPDTLHKQTMLLTRKCKESLLMQGFAEDMVGAQFEGSNSADFKSPKLIYKITEAPYFLTRIDLSNPIPFRYVRYVSPSSEIHVAELQFWGKDASGKDTLLQGKPIQNLGKNCLLTNELKNAFDNNIRTNLNAPAGSWVGLKFDVPQWISQIRYLPRNNFNVIEEGDQYELMYYDRRWKSLGKQIATSQYLEYKDVPTHALFLLRNLTQGVEERIFTYEKGKQVWW